jgi:hypothetical protein
MQFTSKLTKEDLSEFQKMTGSNTNFTLLIIYPIGMIFVSLRLWRASMAFLARTPSSLPYIVLLWIAAVGFVVWTWIYRGQQQEKKLEQRNATRPDTMTFTDTGLNCDGPAGASAHIPWQQFTSWREGRRVFLLKLGQGKRFIILPVSQLSEQDRAPIRQFLQSRIAPISSR